MEKFKEGIMKMGKICNVFSMLKILESGRKYTVNELSEYIEVSPRMIKFYKAELEKAGIYIEAKRGPYGGYIYNKKMDYSISFNIFDVSVLEKILLSKKVAGEHEKELQLIIEKIKAIVIYSNFDSKENDNTNNIDANYLPLSKSIKYNKPITIVHKGKNISFQPQYFNYYKDRVFITGCLTSEEVIRTYSLNEIIVK